MDYFIDCANIGTPHELHRRIAQTLDFPEWYGHNLDGLYDCLCAISRDTRLTLRDLAPQAHFSLAFYSVLTDAAKVNPHFTVRFE